METYLLSWFMENKEIVNPMNPDEVFSCKDLGEDYRICRKEKRMQTAKVGSVANCGEFRMLGKFTYVLNHFLIWMFSSSQQVLLVFRG